jgi:uncharacterized protein (TIGR02421 family)
VHLATTLNGRAQPCCTFLSKTSPSATVTQEGLAVLTEFLSGTSHPQRLLRLANRIEAIARAEAGADFLDIYTFYLEEGETPRGAYQQAHRVFRGSLPTGCGPFTKDLGYSRGLILLLEFLERAHRMGAVDQIAYLFCGKACISEVPNLADLIERGLVVSPNWLPAPFTPPDVHELWNQVARVMNQALPRNFREAGSAPVDSSPPARMLA